MYCSLPCSGDPSSHHLHITLGRIMDTWLNGTIVVFSRLIFIISLCKFNMYLIDLKRFQ